jgi:hypothetical protein
MPPQPLQSKSVIFLQRVHRVTRPAPGSYGDRLVTEAGMSEQQKQAALAHAADLHGEHNAAGRQVLNQLWDLAFEHGQPAALDELQDRFCVCMK